MYYHQPADVLPSPSRLITINQQTYYHQLVDVLPSTSRRITIN